MYPDVDTPEFTPRPLRVGERLHPRVIGGRYRRARRVLAGVLMGLFLAAPWAHVGGQPVFLFHWLARRFVFFGVPFFPQDFHLVAIGLVTFVVFVSVFTVLFGRVWCGWACPQTVFLEFVFRPVEAFFEGTPGARRRLDAAPWGTEKILRRTAKHLVFLVLAGGVGLTGLAYVVGRETAWATLHHPAGHAGTLMAFMAFSAIFYAVFAHLREVACVVICPYGRLQSVLTDRRTMTVAYDDRRGEPRGKIRKKEVVGTATGDCVDCLLCVQVCPTGIDIRNGANQLECVGCTACVDACDSVMDKLARPRGLIRYASPEGIGRAARREVPPCMTGRVVAYGLVLLALLGGLGALLLTRRPVEATLLRAPGQLYQRQPDGGWSNLYTLELTNKTLQATTYEVRARTPGVAVRPVGPPLRAAGGARVRGTLFLSVPAQRATGTPQPVELAILAEGRVIDRVRTTLLTPFPNR
jgi:cytochrome c oxidase accessory protein FixG